LFTSFLNLLKRNSANWLIFYLMGLFTAVWARIAALDKRQRFVSQTRWAMFLL
jgi:uncharacterized membrane protein SirB2